MFTSAKSLSAPISAENSPATRFKNLLASEIPLIYQTESVFGIGCTITNEVAMQHILQLKHRDQNKGFVVIAKDLSSLQPFVLPHLSKEIEISKEQKTASTQATAANIYQQILSAYQVRSQEDLSRTEEINSVTSCALELADPRYFFKLFFTNFLAQEFQLAEILPLITQLNQLAELNASGQEACFQQVFACFTQWFADKLETLGKQLSELETKLAEDLSPSSSGDKQELNSCSQAYQQLLGEAIQLWLKLLISLGYNLTWILPANLAELPQVLTGKFSTLACRIISPHAFLRQLLAEVELPLVSSSLNLSRQEAIKSPEEIAKFYQQVELMLHEQQAQTQPTQDANSPSTLATENSEEIAKTLAIFPQFKEQECFFSKAEGRISLPSVLVNLPYLEQLDSVELFTVWTKQGKPSGNERGEQVAGYETVFTSKLWSQLFLRNLASWQDYQEAVASFYSSYWHNNSLTSLGLNSGIVSKEAFEELYIVQAQTLLTLLGKLSL